MKLTWMLTICQFKYSLRQNAFQNSLSENGEAVLIRNSHNNSIEVVEGYQLESVPCALGAGHRQPFGRNVAPSQGLSVQAWLEGATHPF
jgi:hypothetical protein